jgi:hypothetical protein
MCAFILSRPAGPVRQHLRKLRAARMSWVAIGAQTQLHPVSLARIAKGTAPSVFRYTADAILAVKPSGTVPAGHMPLIGVTRRVRTLVALGYTMREIANALPDSRITAVSQWAAGDQYRRYVRESTWLAVRDLYDRWRDVTPPPSVGRTKALNMAARRNWPGPNAWDEDTIDDPDAQPAEPYQPPSMRDDYVDPHAVERAIGNDRPAVMTWAEVREVVRVLAGKGRDDSVIAAALSSTPDAVLKIRERWGIAAGRPRSRPNEPTTAEPEFSEAELAVLAELDRLLPDPDLDTPQELGAA